MLVMSCRRSDAPQRLAAIGAFPSAPVIVISIDTLRADHLPLFGYKAVETPNIDALRRDGILFTSAWSHVPLTLPSHLTMLTGTLPIDTGVRDNIGYRFAAHGSSLPELLHANGYATGAAVSAYVLRGETGLRSLFDDYDDGVTFQPGVTLGEIQRPGNLTAASAVRWIDAHRGKPFFFLLHLFEPHAPYNPPEPARSRFQNPYDGEIATADAITGDFITALKKSGIYDRAIIVLLSDHGEGLGDHGEKEHGILLYRESLHVPLIVKLPKNTAANATVDAPVGLIDVMPTILRLTIGKVPAALKGASLFAAASLPDRRIFSETMYPRLHLGWSDLRSLAGANHHFIDAPHPELYDLRRDPAETKNIANEERREYASFRAAIDRFPRALQAPSQVDPEEAKKLAALGYLTAQTSPSGPLLDPKEHIGELTMLQQASQQLTEGENEAAIAKLRAILARNPNFTDALVQLGGAYESAGRYAEAADTYKQVLARNPAMSEVVALSLASVYLNLGRYGEARSHAALALERSPGAAHLLLGRIAFAQRDDATAEREARAASSDPHFAPQAAMLMSESLVRRGRAADAVAILENAKRAMDASAAEPPRGFEADLAGAYVHSGRTAEAETSLREEIRRYPHDPRAYGDLAAILVLQGKVDAAQEVMQQLVAAIPSRTSYDLAAELFDHFHQPALASQWRARAASAPR